MFSRLSLLPMAILISVILATVSASKRNLVRKSGNRKGQTRYPSHHGRRATVECEYPALEHFSTFIQVSTYSSHTCSDADQAEVGTRIQYHWDRYVAHNSVLGPIEIDSTLLDDPEDDPKGDRRRLGDDSDDNKKAGPFRYYGPDDKCRYCPRDNSDDRRLSATPVTMTFIFQTDDHPDEMSFELKDSSDDTVHFFNGFEDKNTTKSFEFLLFPGQTYTLVLFDSHGDGWCCASGKGGVGIFDGTQSGGMDLIASFGGDFSTGSSNTFTVPSSGITQRSAGYADPAEILFPELEAGLSEWLTFYIQQEYHHSTSHCLGGKYPSIWVDLESKSVTGTR